MLKKSLVLLSILLLFVGVVGCSQGTVTDNSIDTYETEDHQYPLTITDGTNTEVTIPSEPERIISLIPSLTETLYALGVGEKIVAVTAFDNYPEGVQQDVEYVFEDALNPNIEQIVNLDSDLIVMGPYNEELTEQIRDLGIPAVKFNPQNIEEVYDTIVKLGIITHTEYTAVELKNSMQEKEEQIVSKSSTISEEDKVNVYVEIADGFWTVGKGTFIDELITKAGGINIVEEAGYIQYSEEQILAKNPQVIITTYGSYDPKAVENVKNREGWDNIDAVVNNRVVNVNDDLVNRPGPRIIDGLEEVAKALYPNIFK